MDGNYFMILVSGTVFFTGKLVNCLPYSHADLAQNNYGNFGFPFSNGFSGRRPRPSGGGPVGNLPYGWTAVNPPPQSSAFSPQSGLYRPNMGGNFIGASSSNPDFSFYPSTSNGFVNQPVGLLPGFGQPVSSQFGGNPSFISSSSPMNNFVQTQPDFGGLSQFPAFSPSNSISPSQSFQPSFGNQFSGISSSNNPAFNQQRPVSQFAPQPAPISSPVDDGQLGIVPDIQPNSGLQQFSSGSFRNPVGSSGQQFLPANSGGNGMGLLTSQNSVFAPKPSFSSAGRPQSGGTSSDIFASIMQSMGI